MNRAQPFSMMTMWKSATVLMPTGACNRWTVRLHQLRDHPSAGRIDDAKSAIEKEVTQPVGDPWRVVRLDVRELVDERFVQH